MAAPYAIRVFGDPVLKQRCSEIDNIDDNLKRLAKDMIATMYDAPGVGLAGNQVGVGRRIFVYDDGTGEGPRVMLNPTIHDATGSWTYDEGCLSVPGLYFSITRPKTIHLTGMDLEGNDIDVTVDDYLARIFQHETDHLDGKLLLDRLDPEQRKDALRQLRNRMV